MSSGPCGASNFPTGTKLTTVEYQPLVSDLYLDRMPLHVAISDCGFFLRKNLKAGSCYEKAKRETRKAGLVDDGGHTHTDMMLS